MHVDLSDDKSNEMFVALKARPTKIPKISVEHYHTRLSTTTHEIQFFNYHILSLDFM